MDSMPARQRTIRCRERLLDLSRPVVMGILNVTPDSFFDGGEYQSVDAALRQTASMLETGATIIDIGGMSSRPGSVTVPVQEEMDRVLPVIEAIRAGFPDALLSIDTIHGGVAEAAVAAGAHIINDISAGRMDPDMFPTLARLDVPYILMHMQGTPADMQLAPLYDNAVEEVLDFFTARIKILRVLGVTDLILDVGFGFGKTVAHNYQLLKHLSDFTIFGLPVLAGLSRKSMINRVLGTRPEEALNGTSVLHLVALQQGASILRVHDVREAMEVIRLWEKLETTD